MNRMSVCNFVYSRDLVAQLRTRRRIVGVMFPPSIFEIDDRCVDFRRSMCRPSKIDVSPFEDRCHDVSTFGDRCVDFRRSMCRPSEMDVLTFEDR